MDVHTYGKYRKKAEFYVGSTYYCTAQFVDFVRQDINSVLDDCRLKSILNATYLGYIVRILVPYLLSSTTFLNDLPHSE